jgi:hypothetical protein
MNHDQGNNIYREGSIIVRHLLWLMACYKHFSATKTTKEMPPQSLNGHTLIIM